LRIERPALVIGRGCNAASHRRIASPHRIAASHRRIAAASTTCLLHSLPWPCVTAVLAALLCWCGPVLC